MEKKYFLITIDTEGDNLWDWHDGMSIKTNCVNYLPRFQELCNRYGFKPTWLTNYEVIMNDSYVSFIKKVVADECGELGMHLHAWNTPPEHKIPIEENGQPYLIEFPESIMEAKIKTMTELIFSRTGIRPISHRAGRWAMDDRYFRLLSKYGYKCDCSVTPHISWKTSLGWRKAFGGSDYSLFSEKPYWDKSGILEVPVTIRISNDIVLSEDMSIRNVLGALKRKICKQPMWLRPNGHNVKEMKYVAQSVYEDDDMDYIMFMLHSSEMMPGGSPTFKKNEDIEKLYSDLGSLFEFISHKFKGATLSEYFNYKLTDYYK